MKTLLFFLLFLSFAGSASADGFATAEKRALSDFSARVTSGEETSENQAIINRAEALYKEAAASIDALLPQKKEALEAGYSLRLENLQKQHRRKVRKGIKKINRWLRKQPNQKAARPRAAARKKQLRARLRGWHKRETGKLRLAKEADLDLIDKEYEEAHFQAQSAVDAVYRYLQISPIAPEFFSVVSQENLSLEDTSMMSSAGIGTYRMPLSWSWAQKTAAGEMNWGWFDDVFRTTAIRGLRVAPYVYDTPKFVASDWREMPVGNPTQKNLWRSFLQKAVGRYGPGGDFWRANPALPAMPVRTWQIWNEPNDRWFTQPVDPAKYAELLNDSYSAIKAADPGASVIAAGLFSVSRDKPSEALTPETFFRQMQSSGVRADGFSLHPYSKDATVMAERTGRFRATMLEYGDWPLHITEVGWQSDWATLFGVGTTEAQARELRAAYEYLLRNYRRLHLQTVSWFVWKDVLPSSGACPACAESGLFEEGAGLRPKPAWHALVDIIGQWRQ